MTPEEHEKKKYLVSVKPMIIVADSEDHARDRYRLIVVPFLNSDLIEVEEKK